MQCGFMAVPTGTRPGEIIDALGGTGAVAKMCGIRAPSVSQWRQAGIPKDKLVILGARIERRLKLRRWDLCPDDWHLIWPELIGAEGAPAIDMQPAERDAA